MKAFYLTGPFQDSLGFDTEIRHKSSMLLKCDTTIIDDSIVFADSTDMRIYRPAKNEYQLKLFTKSKEYLGEITFSFYKQYYDKISNLFVWPKPNGDKIEIDFSGIIDSYGNPLPQTWRE